MNSSSSQPARYPRGNILGVGVHAIQMQDALDQIQAWIESRQPNYICVTPAHAVMDCLTDPTVREVYNTSGLCTPDGMAIVWLLRLDKYKNVRRVYGPDLLLAACQRFLKKCYRHYFYGGSKDTLRKLTAHLEKEFPGIRIVGGVSPPFRTLSNKETEKQIADIRNAKPDIVWVGLGSPKQEIWMAEHLPELKVPVLVGVGAAFDFLAGTKSQAPKWMQRMGLEWLFRLATEPRRLWKRYRKYPKFVFLATLQLLGIRKYKLE
jgi:N-acetylglucosaminyldiphosphoundecaprenol N-acetyl-beta-D-mannosaminyltransferase